MESPSQNEFHCSGPSFEFFLLAYVNRGAHFYLGKSFLTMFTLHQTSLLFQHISAQLDFLILYVYMYVPFLKQCVRTVSKPWAKLRHRMHWWPPPPKKKKVSKFSSTKEQMPALVVVRVLAISLGIRSQLGTIYNYILDTITGYIGMYAWMHLGML
jgi:hypothetical protein